MHWTIQQVAGVWGVRAPAGLEPQARLAGISIDSRTVSRGELFFAIHGPRHDGHAFVPAALASGATAAVVAQSRLGEYSWEVRSKLLGVADTPAALQQLACAVRRDWGGPLAAVAGSVGKTTTKEILAALVASRLRVLKTEGNLNNEFGLPLTLARLEPEHQAAVVELGMSHAGELRALSKIAQPQVGVITRVAVEHLEFFASLEEIAAAERELIEELSGPQAVAVLNADDERVARFAPLAPGRVITFGAAKAADFRVQQITDRGARGSTFTVDTPQGHARLELSLAGRHNISNALAALAAASVFGITLADAARALPQVKPASMRGEILRFEDGLTVINDCYNSSPAALASMLDLLATESHARRRILVAGEMLELGPASPELHREAGRDAARRELDWIIGVQGEAAELVRSAQDAGQPEARTRFFPDAAAAAVFVGSLVSPGDVLLVKGSRGVRMERIVEALCERRAPSTAGAATRERG
jgi:UDP-N-acetylmuramoyl-tripeptide--D-alanyl-D-alanine ligase